MSETKTIVTKVEKVFDAKDSGWIDIKLGNEWRVSTKKAAIANQGRQFEGQVAAVDYIENQNGQYMNRWVQAFRVPAAHEVNGSDVAGAVPQAGISIPLPTSQDEFKRSKEEMRRTEALHIAALILGPGTGTVALGLKADEVEALIQEKA